MKKIYFVRHGERQGNIGVARLGHKGLLTENGIKQAEIVALRFKNIPIDLVISSDWTRAKHTAEIINKALDKKVEFSPLFAERKRASEELEKRKDDPVVLEMNRLIYENHGVPGWRYSDEENFDDLKTRALKVLDFLKNTKEENILVVTHGMFMGMIASCMIFGKDLTSAEHRRFVITFDTDNTGITFCEWDKVNPPKRHNEWSILVWNDHAHLG